MHCSRFRILLRVIYEVYFKIQIQLVFRALGYMYTENLSPKCMFYTTYFCCMIFIMHIHYTWHCVFHRTIGTGHPHTNHAANRFPSIFCVNVESSAYCRGASYDDFRFRTNQHPQCIQKLQRDISSSSCGNLRLFLLNTQYGWGTVYWINEKCRNTWRFIYGIDKYPRYVNQNVYWAFWREWQRLCADIQGWIWINR